MRGAATLFLFALLAVATFAQTPASPNNAPSSAPPAQSPNATPPSGAATGTATDGQPGQNAALPAQTAPGTMAASDLDHVAAGTEIRATLDTPLSTKTSKPGDRFTASITQPVVGSNGSVVIPNGARVEGEVADTDESKALALRDKGKLSLRFRDLVLPTGQTVSLTATLISVNDTGGKNLKKVGNQGQSNARNTDVAMGGNGAVAAPVFGSPLKGLAIGALGGGGYVLATKGKEVNLPAQTGMVIRLDQPVSGGGISSPQQ